MASITDWVQQTSQTGSFHSSACSLSFHKGFLFLLQSKLQNPLVAIRLLLGGLIVAHSMSDVDEMVASVLREIVDIADIVLCSSCWDDWSKSVYGAYQGIPRCFHEDRIHQELHPAPELATFEVDTLSPTSAEPAMTQEPSVVYTDTPDKATQFEWFELNLLPKLPMPLF